MLALKIRRVVNRAQNNTTKKPTTDKRLSGEKMFSNSANKDQNIKAKILFRKGMGDTVFNLYFVNYFLEFFSTSTTDFVILFVKTIDSIT